MAFKHLDRRQVADAQWDHVESLGVKTVFGNAFNRRIWDLTVDEERGFYLVSRGMYGPNMTGTGKSIYFYALCLDDNVFYFDVEKEFKGKVAENNFEHYWHIVRIEFPDGWSFDSLSVEEFKQIVIEAFTAETYEIYEPEMVKVLTVDFSESSEIEVKNRYKQ